MTERCRIICADVLDGLQSLDDESVHCVVTSPPYWGLRDYGTPGQLGLEKTPQEYIERMVGVFRDVRRVLRKDGTLWLNMGDSYARMQENNVPQTKNPKVIPAAMTGRVKNAGLKPKDLMMMPARLAIALQEDGWYLRSDIIWSKPNPMPESVTDRPTTAHEHVFLLSKSPTYFYDAEAIKEKAVYPGDLGLLRGIIPDDPDPNVSWHAKSIADRKTDKQRGHSRRHAGFNDRWDLMTKDEQCNMGRNKRSVWTIATEPYPEAHFATYPTALVKPCILAGCPKDGIVIDPFCGSGTTGLVALQYGRQFIGIELNPEYVEMAKKRIKPAIDQELLPL